MARSVGRLRARGWGRVMGVWPERAGRAFAAVAGEFERMQNGLDQAWWAVAGVTAVRDGAVSRRRRSF